MDPKVKQQNMNLDLEHNQDAEQELYETSNRSIVLEWRSLPHKHDPHDIKCFQLTLEWKEKFGMGFT